MIWTRNVLENEYPMVLEWFKEHTGNKTSTDALSQTGFMACNKRNQPIAAIFFFEIVNCPVALFGWPISNPKQGTMREKAVAVDTLYKEVEAYAKILGYKYITSYAGTNSIHKKLQELGYNTGDENMTQYIKRIGE